MAYTPVRARISGGCEQVLVLKKEELDRQRERASRAKRLGEDVPQPDPPRVGEARWVSWAARILTRFGVPKWMRDVDVCKALEQDMVGELLARFITWPEFHILEGWLIEVRWTPSPIVRKDFVSTECVAARPKVVPPADREAWLGGEDAPQFRLELSLSWWLLADEIERERGLHEALAYFGVTDNQPVLRKPDIVGHAPTLGRFGVRNAREADAVFHAQRHPSHELILKEYGFDPVTGLGQRWEPGGPAQSSLLQLVPTTRKAVTKLEEA